jgi:hypothetical protein
VKLDRLHRLPRLFSIGMIGGMLWLIVAVLVVVVLWQMGKQKEQQQELQATRAVAIETQARTALDPMQWLNAMEASVAAGKLDDAMSLIQGYFGKACRIFADDVSNLKFGCLDKGELSKDDMLYHLVATLRFMMTLDLCEAALRMKLGLPSQQRRAEKVLDEVRLREHVRTIGSADQHLKLIDDQIGTTLSKGRELIEAWQGPPDLPRLIMAMSATADEVLALNTYLGSLKFVLDGRDPDAPLSLSATAT